MIDLGVDTYCFHRLFGEVYDTQEKPFEPFTVEDFLDYCNRIGADGVSLQSCFLPSEDPGYLSELGAQLDERGFKNRIYAWGHPSGLDGGTNEAMLKDLKEKIPLVPLIGTDVMRVAGAGYMHRNGNQVQMVNDQIRMFSEAVKVAEDCGVKLALENHNDLPLHCYMEIIEGVDSPYFGATFDTLNWIRVSEDPMKAAMALGEKIFAVHLKDGIVVPDLDPDNWVFISCVPAGWGYVPVQEFLGYLNTIGFDGLVAIEFDNYIPQLDGYEKESVSISLGNLKRMRACLP